MGLARRGLGLAAIHLFGTLPLVLWAIPAPPARIEGASVDNPAAPRLAGREAIVFGLIAAMLVLNGLIVGSVAIWLLTFLQAQGLSLSAPVALGALIGPAQVGARVLEMAGRGRHHPIWKLAISTFAIAQAPAPVLGAWVIAGAGPAATLWILSALALANVGFLALLWRSIRG